MQAKHRLATSIQSDCPVDVRSGATTGLAEVLSGTIAGEAGLAGGGRNRPPKNASHRKGAKDAKLRKGMPAKRRIVASLIRFPLRSFAPLRLCGETKLESIVGIEFAPQPLVEVLHAV